MDAPDRIEPGFLEIDGITAGYGAVDVLRGVSLSVGHGEVVCLLGPNGAGKTTLLRTISGLIHPRHGSVRLRGEAIQGRPSHQIVSRRLVQVPEGRAIFGPLTVAENLRLGAYVDRRTIGRAALAERYEAVYRIFPRLAERAAQQAGTMSGGEQQMLAIGRALMSDPEIMLLDEPSMGLAPNITVQIFETLGRLRHERALTILIAEQNVERVLALADRAYVMATGSIRLEAPAERLRADREKVRRMYLGANV